MAEAPPRKSQLSASLWALVFAVCLVLAAAHLAVSTLEQSQEETGLIEATFTGSARPSLE
jgi:Ca2+/H+ antiporter